MTDRMGIVSSRFTVAGGVMSAGGKTMECGFTNTAVAAFEI